MGCRQIPFHDIQSDLVGNVWEISMTQEAYENLAEALAKQWFVATAEEQDEWASLIHQLDAIAQRKGLEIVTL